MAKQKFESPIGEFNYTVVTGQGKENYDGDGYIYQCLVDVPEDEAQDTIDDIEDFLEDHAPKGAKLVDNRPYQTHDDYDAIPEGMVRFTVKTNTEFEDQKTGDTKDANVLILDTNGKSCNLPEGVLIGNGTTGKAIGTMFTYERGARNNLECGISLGLNKIQIKDFVPYEGEVVEAIEEGSFKGFDSGLQSAEGTQEDEKTRRRDRKSRNRRNQ